MLKKILISMFLLQEITLLCQAQATPIDVRLNTINATAREAFAIKSDIAAQRAKPGQESNNTVSTLKDQLRERRERINKDVEDLKKIIFADL